MARITEDYVSFETAKLLKEKGFIENCIMRYNRVGDLVEEAYKFNWNFQTIDYSAPTLQMAMKWLREVHKYFIEIRYSFEGEGECGYVFKIRKIEEDDIGIWSLNDKLYDSYEDACEVAIKRCSENLI